jgi:tetraprenyl-beta-curcumene synthase
MSAIADRGFMARAIWALACAQVRYWLGVDPIVRRQLRRWETCANEIPDPPLANLALSKITSERFNVEAGAMIATIAPAQFRGRAVEAIVALQVMYDYLDALTEQPAADPLRAGLQYSQAFTDAFRTGVQPVEDYYAHHPAGSGDGGYLAGLALAVRTALADLPAAEAIAEVALVTAARFAEAQVRIHAAAHTGKPQLERWADQQAAGTNLEWREWLFGAMGSVVAAHALIALAADEHATREQARTLDDAYLELCVLTTALDHLVDYERDANTGEQSYIHLYETREQLAEQMAVIVNRVKKRARAIPNGAHHLMILSGVVAYYTSQPSAMGDFARPVTEHVRDQLRPLISPTLATMHAWRLAKRAGPLRHPLRAMRTYGGASGDNLVRALDGGRALRSVKVVCGVARSGRARLYELLRCFHPRK